MGSIIHTDSCFKKVRRFIGSKVRYHLRIVSQETISAGDEAYRPEKPKKPYHQAEIGKVMYPVKGTQKPVSRKAEAAWCRIHRVLIPSMTRKDRASGAGDGDR